MASRGNEGSLPLVSLAYPDEVICAAEVHRGENSGSMGMFECRWGERKSITELNCDFVECPVIDTRPQASVLLGHEEKARSRRGR